ncbi:MAG: sigma factor-like helix-turn-helix DNA-binding protein [Armatimonadota bacterium]
MTRSPAEQRDDQRVQGEFAGTRPDLREAERCEIRRLASLVRLAVGRLGGRISPWLDEGLLMGQGLMTVLEMRGAGADGFTPEADAAGEVVRSMRAWARASSWYQAAWPCRIAPLCCSLAERGSEDAGDHETARDLGLDETRLAERYVEAGLLFAVSPELLLPRLLLRDRPAGPRGSTHDDGRLKSAISELPLQQRQALALYFEDGLTFPEIAELLKITPDAAQAAFGRAATRIRAGVFGSRLLTGVSV